MVASGKFSQRRRQIEKLARGQVSFAELHGIYATGEGGFDGGDERTVPDLFAISNQQEAKRHAHGYSTRPSSGLDAVAYNLRAMRPARKALRPASTPRRMA